MTPTDAVILGIVQGLTEFLPVSSSGHLVIVERLLGIGAADLSFPVAVHLGTLLAVLVYFRQRIKDILIALAGAKGRGESHASMSKSGATRSLFWFILLGSVPAGIVGVFFKDRIEIAFAAPFVAAVCLVVTGIWLIIAGGFPARTGPITWWRSWWIGVAQAVAVIPGISRSGSTIASGMMLGVLPSDAAEFSFLLSIPAVAGATLLAMPKALAAGQIGMVHLIGLIVSAVAGYPALRLVFAVIRHGRFAWFGAYCLIAGGAAAILLY